MRIGQKLKRQLGFLMSVLCAVSLVACGTKYADAPALLEPVSGTESYREVSVGDVGDLKIAYGSIVPTEHAVFWTTQVSVAEVLVDVGDYVEAGQVVATADLPMLTVLRLTAKRSPTSRSTVKQATGSGRSPESARAKT